MCSPIVRECSPDNFAEVAAFLSRQSGSTAAEIEKRLLRLLDNPVRQPDIPLGLIAYAGDSICGTMICIPHRFTNGQETRTCILSTLFYVASEARGAGLPIFLEFRKLTNRYPVYAATANVESAKLWKAFGAKAVDGSDREYIRIRRWAPVVKELVLRIIPGLQRPSKVTDILAHWDPTKESQLAPLDLDKVSPENGLPNDGRFEVFRDTEFLRWKIYDVGERVYRYRSQFSECLLTVQSGHRGRAGQIRYVEIQELWGGFDRRDNAALLHAIDRQFSPDIISARGTSSLFAHSPNCESLFHRRNFKSPTTWFLDPNGILHAGVRYSPLAGE